MNMRISCRPRRDALASVPVFGAQLDGGNIGLAIGIGIFSFALSLAVTAVVVVRLPADYFTRTDRPLPLAGYPTWARISARVGHNVVGVLLIIMGVVMSLPGVPGQGFLTVLLGLMLVDLPGKRRLEVALVRRPMVHGAIDRVRARFGKPPIEIPPRHGPVDER